MAEGFGRLFEMEREECFLAWGKVWKQVEGEFTHGAPDIDFHTRVNSQFIVMSDYHHVDSQRTKIMSMENTIKFLYLCKYNFLEYRRLKIFIQVLPQVFLSADDITGIDVV